MLLLHQTGSVKVGEVVRYTLTYTPSHDRILPPPGHLYVKIKNTAAIPLRAAYLHGPYTLYVACYPSTFNPYKKHVRYKEEGAPDFEPQLKAGGQWYARLTVPEEVRNDAYHASPGGRKDVDRTERKSFTWIIEVASQIIFSRTASVSFDVLVGRDEKSVELGLHGVIGANQGLPGTLADHHQGSSKNAAQRRGVFSKAVRLAVDDTESLWNTPPFPSWEDDGDVKVEEGPQHGDKRDAAAKKNEKQRRQKKIHLVLLTHGLHSNLGADMLYMKEGIDTAAKQAREDSKKRKAERRQAQESAQSTLEGDDGRRSNSAQLDNASDDEEDEEQVIVRGYNGNAVRTERGIQYLGKRFAKYVLSLTYPDQPYLPAKSEKGKNLTKSFTGSKPTPQSGAEPSHKNSSIIKDENHSKHKLPYRITSISFVGHSLGGLVQTYAIAYIQKHSPDFFDLIKPVNFIALATPFLGLSNENPVYVKFALDFGLVGRTGQDLGLTWRAPTLAKSGWGAVISGLTSEAQKAHKEPDPGAKPLLRVLPTGPAHVALKKFRNRTVYSNVVNDGIVPLRTSCLLFLDWRGLGRVEKARRENGLVGTMVEWGWAEVTGQNVSKKLSWSAQLSDSGDESNNNADKTSSDPESNVPQAEASQGFDNDERAQPKANQFLRRSTDQSSVQSGDASVTTSSTAPNLWTGLLNFFRPQAGEHKPEPKGPRKVKKIYRRGQTMHHQDDNGQQGSGTATPDEEAHDSHDDGGSSGRKGLVRGSSLYTTNSNEGEVEAPPRTSFFESAGDLLNPPLPTREFILDPGARPRTIWHDRVYHPEDIPPPPTKRQRTFMLKRAGSQSQPDLANDSLHPEQSSQSSGQSQSQAVGTMKIEEKIARAYHKDLSWRKVLVRLEPDAHNNIIVRRMFANAYGWPVVKHVCDTHFAFTASAQTRDEDEPSTERVKLRSHAVQPGGEQVEGQTKQPAEQDEKEQQPHAPNDHDDDDHGQPLVRSPTAEAEDVVVTAASPSREADAREELQRQKLHTGWQTRQRSVRTESESRESRDDVSELVSKISVGGESSYHSMNSGKAALARLARQDSARWSDRFFEGSDEGEDEGDDDSVLANEIRRARARAELDKLSVESYDDDVDHDGQDQEHQATTTSARIAAALTASPQSTKLVPSSKKQEADDSYAAGQGQGVGHNNRITEPEEAPLTAEPAELEPLSHSHSHSPSGTSTSTLPEQGHWHGHQDHDVEESDLGGTSTGSPSPGTATAGSALGLALADHVTPDERLQRMALQEGGPSTSPTSASGGGPDRDGHGVPVGIVEQVARVRSKEQQQ